MTCSFERLGRDGQDGGVFLAAALFCFLLKKQTKHPRNWKLL